MFSRLSRAAANEYQDQNNNINVIASVHPAVNNQMSNPTWGDIVGACRNRGSTAGDQNAVCVQNQGDQDAQSTMRLSGRKRSRYDYEGLLELTPNKRPKLESGDNKEALKVSSLLMKFWKWTSDWMFSRRRGESL